METGVFSVNCTHICLFLKKNSYQKSKLLYQMKYIDNYFWKYLKLLKVSNIISFDGFDRIDHKSGSHYNVIKKISIKDISVSKFKI